jgi:transposase-like protein
MVRSRKRTTEKAKWTEQELEAAIRAVREGRSVKSVARQFNIARTTLRDRLKSGNMSKARLCRKQLLTAALEKELADHVLLLAKICFGMTQTELRRLAFEIAERSGIQNNFNKNERLAGID